MAGRVIDVTMQLNDKVTSPLQGVTASLEASSKQWQRMGKNITNTGKNITKVGEGLTTAITLPVAAAGTACFNNFSQVDSTLRLVQQTMGSTESEAKLLESALMDAAGNSVFGMNDAAEASLNFARAGFSAEESAALVAPSFALAAGTATDLSVVTEGLGSTMKLFGADISEAADYSDVFATAQSLANTTVTDMLDATANAGSMFNTVGWSVKDLAVATGILGDAMVSGSEGGNALKSGLANLTTNDTAIKMLEQLGVEVVNNDGTFKSFAETQSLLHDAFLDLSDAEQVAAGEALFGKNQMAKWLTIIQKSPDDLQGMIGALDQAGGSAQGMADALMSGSGGAMESLKSSIDVLGYSMGQFVAKYATPVIQKIIKIVDWFVNLDDATKDNIVKWAGIAAAVGPVLVVFGKLVMFIGGIVTTVGKIGGAIKAAGGIMAALTGPGAIVVAVLAAIGVAIALVVTHWDQCKAAAQAFFDQIQPLIQFLKDKWQELGDKFEEIWTSKIQPAWQKFSDKASEVWTLIQPTLEKIGALMKDIFEVRFKASIDLACDIFQFLGDVVGSVVEYLLDTFSGVIDVVVGVFTQDWERAWDGVKEIFDAKINLIRGIADAAATFIKEVLGGIGSYISGLFEKLDNLKNKTASAGNAAGVDTGSAVGRSYWQGGMTRIHERGAEVIDLPKGTRIWPHSESLKLAYQQGQASGGGGKGNITITVAKLAESIQVRSDSDIEAIAVALANKLEQTAQNIGGGELGYVY